MSSASAALRLMMDLMLEWKSTMTVSAKMLLLLCLSVHGCQWHGLVAAFSGLEMHVMSCCAPLQKLCLVATCGMLLSGLHALLGMVTVSW